MNLMTELEELIDYILSVCSTQQRFLDEESLWDSYKRRTSLNKETFLDSYNDVKEAITNCVKAKNPNFSNFVIA